MGKDLKMAMVRDLWENSHTHILTNDSIDLVIHSCKVTKGSKGKYRNLHCCKITLALLIEKTVIFLSNQRLGKDNMKNRKYFIRHNLCFLDIKGGGKPFCFFISHTEQSNNSKKTKILILH